jgi:hypothetical protein
LSTKLGLPLDNVGSNWTKVNQEADQGQEAEVITQEQDLGDLVTQSTITWSSTSRLLCHGDKIPPQRARLSTKFVIECQDIFGKVKYLFKVF